jgi:hypothetical protein
MALNQTNRNGQVFIEGTAADIEAARESAVLVRGRQYWETDGGFRVGRATANNVIVWERTQSDINAAVAIETAARIASDSILDQKISTEISDRQLAVQAEADFRVLRDQQLEALINAEAATRLANDDTEIALRIAGDLANASALAAEITRNTTALDAEIVLRTSEDLRIETAAAAALNAAVEALKDDRVTSFSGKTYTQGQTMTVASLFPSGAKKEGVHLFKFNSTDTSNTATVSGLPSGGANIEISYNDIVKVTVDGGAVTAVELVDDAIKAVLDSMLAAIAALQAATTTTAIRSHFSGGNLIDIVNGIVAFNLSQDANNDLAKSLVDGGLKIVIGETNVTYTNDANALTTATVNTTFTDVYSKLKTLQSATVGAESGVSVVNGKVHLGGLPLLENAVFTGAFAMDMGGVAVVKVPYATYKCYTKVHNVDGSVSRTAATGAVVESWFDQDGDPQFTFVPNL